MKIILPKERPMSWNILYAGRHWFVRREEATRVHNLIIYTLREMKVEPEYNSFTERVDITITTYFKSSPMDPDNICSKFYIDGLKGMVIQDDSYKYIKSVKNVVEIDRENPRMEIEIL
jgi:hypothetical protein